MTEELNLHAHDLPREYSRRITIQPGERLTMETIVTDPDFFGLEKATATQRAICRVSDGLPLGELWDDPLVRESLRDVKPPEVIPDEMAVFCAVRSYKSGMAAAKIFQSTQEIRLDGTSIRPGDKIVLPVLAIDKKGAQAVMSHLVGNLMTKHHLSALIVGKPLAETVVIRHPSGWPIEVSIKALSRYGGSVVSFWCAGLVLDEVSRMSGEEDGVLNMDETIGAARPRMLPGAQPWFIGSPYVPFGPAYKMDRDHLGKPTKALVVFRATGPAMHPDWWTPARCEELKQKAPEAYQRDVLALFVDVDSALFPFSLLEKRMRKAPETLEPHPRSHYAAAMDPATRSNHWTLVVGTNLETRDGFRRDSVAMARQWKPGMEPLAPEKVFDEMADALAPYRVTNIRTDQWSFDTLRALARRICTCRTCPEEELEDGSGATVRWRKTDNPECKGLLLSGEKITHDRKVQIYDNLRKRLDIGEIELSPDEAVREDLVRIKKKSTQSGVDIVLPLTGDGGHADYGPAIAMLFAYKIRPPEPDPLHVGSPEWHREQNEQLRDKMVADREKRQRKIGWAGAMREALWR